MENSNEITVVNTEQGVGLQSPEPYISESDRKRQSFVTMFGERRVCEAELIKNTRWLDLSLEAILAMGVYANQYGFSLEQALFGNVLYYMKGKINLQGIGVAALIRNNGHSYQVLRNFEPLYKTDNPRNLFLDGTPIKNENGKNEFVTFKHPATNETTFDMVTTIIGYRKGEEDKPQIVNYTLSQLLRSYRKSKEKTLAEILDHIEKHAIHHLYWKCIHLLAKQLYPDLIAGMTLMDDVSNSVIEDGVHLTPNEQGVYTDIENEV